MDNTAAFLGTSGGPSRPSPNPWCIGALTHSPPRVHLMVGLGKDGFL